MVRLVALGPATVLPVRQKDPPFADDPARVGWVGRAELYRTAGPGGLSIQLAPSNFLGRQGGES
jgi:hypothetical protein